MKVLADGRVWLDAGEILPVFCYCGHVYQPAAESERSDCPKCSRHNVHEKAELRPLAPGELD